MPHMSLQSLHLFGHGVEVLSIILLLRGLHSPKSGTDGVPVGVRRRDHCDLREVMSTISQNGSTMASC